MINVADRQIRRLSEKERGCTRNLYELCFPEDGRAFVDYYYREVVSQNEIYVVSEKDEILSMVHLNPYELTVGKMECKVPYIVAVATHPKYRHQGLMTSLFQKIFSDLWKRKVPFAFLMPAKESIYRPMGFRFISQQNRVEIPVKDCLRSQRLTVRPASWADIPDLTWISKRLLKGTYAKRTEQYYERMLLEQESQDGDIAILEKDGMICGWFYVSEENGVPMVRETVVEKQWEGLLLPSIAECYRFDEKIQIHGFFADLGGEAYPMMMGRIVDLAAYVSLVQERIPEGFSFTITDPVIQENQGSYVWREGKLQKIVGKPGLPFLNVEDIMEKFPLPAPVFLNELV